MQFAKSLEDLVDRQSCFQSFAGAHGDGQAAMADASEPASQDGALLEEDEIRVRGHVSRVPEPSVGMQEIIEIEDVVVECESTAWLAWRDALPHKNVARVAAEMAQSGLA